MQPVRLHSPRVAETLGKGQHADGEAPSDLAKMSPKEATNIIFDLVVTLEARQHTEFYIANIVKPLKSWLEFNQIVSRLGFFRLKVMEGDLSRTLGRDLR